MRDERNDVVTVGSGQVGEVGSEELLGKGADDGEGSNLAHGQGHRSGGETARAEMRPLASSLVRSVVVLPTFNEADNITDMLAAIREAAPDTDVMVVDDNSPDGTGALAEQAAALLGRVVVVHREGKAGLGTAYRHGFALAFEQGYDVIVSMDCDFSHDPKVIPDMLALVDGGADVVVGSRYVAGGGTVDWPLHRRLLSKWGNRYTGAMLGMHVRDCTSGFRAYRALKLQGVDPQSTTAEGYAFLTELVRRLALRGAVVVETPIIFKDRERGTSKMSSRIIIESMTLVTRWGVSDRWRSWRGGERR
jgi:dolichol-phosphate mannosyltransferase